MRADALYLGYRTPHPVAIIGADLSQPARRVSLATFVDLWFDGYCSGLMCDRDDLAAFAIMGEIARRVDPATLAATAGVGELAAASGVSYDYARRLIGVLCARGLIHFKRGDGRGNKSTFRPRTQFSYLVEVRP